MPKEGAITERGEALHFNLRTALGIGVPVLLGSALAAGVAAFPANATSYQDTSLSASAVTVSTFSEGSSLSVSNPTDTTIGLSGTNVTWSLHGTVPAGVALTDVDTITCSGCTADTTGEIVAVATDSAGNAEAIEIDVTIATASSIQKTGTPVTDTVTGLTDTTSSGNVTFSAASSGSNGITFAESNLPTGLSSGNPTLSYSGGTAAPGTYDEVKVSATDSDGAVENGTFTLTVDANTVSGSTYGDYVNEFGYGFDSYRQHDYAGATIVGWTATQSDPATHFELNNGTHSGAIQLEYAPNGTGSGLCVSDPAGGWGSDPLRDGLILANCNTGPFQQFIPQSDGTLINVATGLYVNPDGKGAQLRGESSTVGWGGASYTWTAEGSLAG
jgi:hypothetical protein